MSIMLLYGASNSSKTTQLADFHQWYFETHPGAPIGWHVTADSSFIPFQDAIAKGCVRVWDVNYENTLLNPDGQSYSNPLKALHIACSGYVPRDVSPEGKRLSNEWIKHEGVLTLEGLLMFGEAIMRYMMNGQNLQNVSFYEQSGTAVGQAHLNTYNLVRTQIMSMIVQTRSLSNPYVIWTSHEGVGTNSVDKAMVLGPAMITKSGLDKVTPNFAHALRLEPLEVQTANGTTEVHRILHIDSHKDPTTGLMWPCKLSLPLSKLQLMRKLSDYYGTPNCVPCVVKSDGTLEGGLKAIAQVMEWQPKGST